MKKLIAILMIGICNFLITGCEGENTNKPPQGDPIDCEVTPEHESCQPELPPVDDNDYTKYLEELKAIANTQTGVIFEDYSKFTDELGKYMYYGTYPGREVTNKDLIKDLEAIQTTNEFGYIDFQDLQFVKVTIENTYTSLDIGDDAYASSTLYEIGTTHYFLVEPILWRILNLDNVNQQAFMITENIIEAKIYVNETNERFIDGRKVFPSNYEYSDVRKWCNNDFLNQAFKEDEKNKLSLMTIKNQCVFYASDDTKLYNDRSTDDYVYIPSFQDVTKRAYGFETEGICSYSRYASPSNYASAKGVYTFTDNEGLPYTGLYLLRSGAEFARSFSYFVKYDGYALNPYYVNSPSTGVRVCINVATTNTENILG